MDQPGMLPSGRPRPGGDELAAWAEGLGHSRPVCAAAGAFGSRFTAGSPPETGRIRSPRGHGFEPPLHMNEGRVMAYGHAERNLALLHWLEAETR